jgi:hypothetical protein
LNNIASNEKEGEKAATHKKELKIYEMNVMVVDENVSEFSVKNWSIWHEM